MLKEITRAAIIVIISIIAGYLLIALAYAIPSEAMADEAYLSAQQLSEEWSYSADNISWRQLDNYTDSLMLLTAEYSGDEDIFNKAIYAYSPIWQNEEGISDYHLTLLALQLDGVTDYDVSGYGKYWHGYLSFLRPIHSVLSYGAIRNLNFVLQFSLVAAILLLMLKKAPRYILPFLIMLYYMAPTAIAKSLQFSSVHYAMLIVTLLILWNPKGIINNRNIIYLFLMTGIVTVYLDLLTAPTVTLTVPLLIWCILIKDSLNEKELFKTIFKCSAFWAAGYAAMWIGKWLLALIYGAGNVLKSAIGSALYRSGSDNGNFHFTRFDSLAKVFDVMFTPRTITLVTSAFFVLLILLLLYKRKKLDPSTIRRAAVIFLIAFIPIAWIMFLNNHSNIHSFFVYRNICPSLFCLLSVLTMCIPAAGKKAGSLAPGE